ncbi:MAG TPA: hypothetical protein DCY25_07730 [Bacteroidales bacterium]|nr:hypothetical protein [Bacteroidales bacterium]
MAKEISKFVLNRKMSEKNKNINRQDSDFLRYHSNQMTEGERNAFEKKLQKDPFAEEASEGFSSLDTVAAERDLAELEERIRKRSSGSRRRLWYGIAASVTVLIAVSSILLLTRPKDRIEEIAYNQTESKTGEITIPKAEPVKDMSEIQSLESAESAPVNKKPGADQPAAMAAGELASGKNKQEETIKKEDLAKTYDQVRPAEIQEAKDAVMAEKRTETKAVLAGRAALQPASISGRIISSEDNLPLPGASIMIKGTKEGTVSDENGNFVLEGAGNLNAILLVASYLGMDSKEFKPVPGAGNEIKLDPSALALNEVVVIGYGVSGKSSGYEDDVSGYSPPAPVTGQREFNRYISENIVLPDTATASQKNVVVLAFRVSEEGKIDSITVVRSPGMIFTNEAIRLIKEGPAWNPARENGEAIPDEVRIRIVFK